MTLPVLPDATRELLERVLAEHRDPIIDTGTDWVIAAATDLRGQRPRAETRMLAERAFDMYCVLLTGDTRPRDEFIEFTTSFRVSSEFHISTLLRGFLCFKRGAEIVMDGLEIAGEARLAVQRVLDELYYDVAFRMADVYSQKLLTMIRQTQTQLLQREKLAALGSLVAGVAHEINTPMGVAVTAASLVHDRVVALERAFDQGELRKSSLSEFFAGARPAIAMTLANLERAAELIVAFKHVAVDQAQSSARRVHLASTLRDVMVSLTPLYRHGGHRIVIDLDESLEVETHPGALAQIVTNLIQNALTHAFAAGQAGKIELRLGRVEGAIELAVTDDGRGLTADEQVHIFEPFFTTRRGTGGSGLGMHVVHNLVTELLRGTITIESSPGVGTRIAIRFPAGGE